MVAIVVFHPSTKHNYNSLACVCWLTEENQDFTSNTWLSTLAGGAARNTRQNEPTVGNLE